MAGPTTKLSRAWAGTSLPYDNAWPKRRPGALGWVFLSTLLEQEHAQFPKRLCYDGFWQPANQLCFSHAPI